MYYGVAVAVLQILKSIIAGIEALIVPICFVSAWFLVALTTWSIWSTIRDTAARTHRLHQIPCANCQYFTSSYHLKCTVHPGTALTEEAIDCMDYEAKDHDYHLTNVSQRW
jgi:ABC-type nickel/cobalt efflux system permease component RcnA